MPSGRLSGRVAIITGAGGGIGAATGALFADEGAGVVLADVDYSACHAVAQSIARAGPYGRAVARHLDVTDAQSWSAVTAFARRRFGYPTVLVNCAGVMAVGGIEDLADEGWASVVDVCQRAIWLGMRAVLGSMRMAGGGAIVNVGSVFGQVGSGAAFAYHGAKGAVRALTTAAAVECAGQKVRVNSISPGLVDTKMAADLPAAFVDAYLEATPLGRMGTAEEVARAALFLASDEASYITGAELVVDGGYLAR